jgi:Papain family cysteine protease
VADVFGVLRDSVSLSPSEEAVLRAAGVRSFEDVDSLLRYFPSITKAGVRRRDISASISMRLNHVYAGASPQGSNPVWPPVAYGAEQPPGVSWAIGAEVPIPPIGSGPSGGTALPPSGKIDLRFPLWPIRNQGGRGTCVAFAAAACAEIGLMGSVASPTDLSEQFLYWAIKTRTTDPWPNLDGTLLQFALEALSGTGICDEPQWPYNPNIIPNNVSHGGTGDPRASAVATGKTNCCAGPTYRRSPAGGASLVLDALRTGTPVAISLPLFGDHPAAPTNNWTTTSGWLWGRVLDPPPTAVITGGHAVCVTGFEPDPGESLGGYFTFRNSWSPTWASDAPSPGNGYAPEAGYGEVSATYVDKYLWELFHW